MESLVLGDESKKTRKFSHRNRIDTMACILESCNESSKRRRLIYACNLDSAQFDLFKDCLVEAGLLASSLEEGLETFKATEKGKEFLVDYRRIRSLSK